MREVVIINAFGTPNEMIQRAAEGQRMRYWLATLCASVGQGEAMIIGMS